MTTPESKFLLLCRSLGHEEQQLLMKLLSGIVSGRLKLTSEEAKLMSRADIEDLAQRFLQ